MLAPLVTETASHFNVERVSADKAYCFDVQLRT